MQLSSYENITQENIIFNEAKSTKSKIARLNTNVFQLKSNIQIKKKVH